MEVKMNTRELKEEMEMMYNCQFAEQFVEQVKKLGATEESTIVMYDEFTDSDALGTIDGKEFGENYESEEFELVWM